MATPEDGDLIKSIKNGDIKGFEILFHKYYPRFFAFIKGFVKDEWTAEDITQNIFMKVWIHRVTLDENLSMTSYLYVLAKYEIYNFFRSKRRSLLEVRPTIPDDIASDQGVEEQYHFTELNEIINKAVDQMPEKRQIIFRMSRYEFLSAKEIAEKMNLSVRTVEKHIELALRDIREKVGPFSFLLFLLFIK